MGKNQLKESRDRNMRFKPWTKLIPYEVSDFEKGDGIVNAFQNHILTVFLKPMVMDGFTHQSIREDGKIAVYQLLCKWTDPNRRDDIDLKYLKRARDEICEPECEAVYHFPASYREVKTRFTDVWVFEKGFVMPFGRFPNESDMEQNMVEALGGEVITLMKEDLEVCVVVHNQGSENLITEVFSSIDECNAAYAGKLPEGTSCSIMMLGDVPTECENVAWTQDAKMKLAKVISVSKTHAISHSESDFFVTEDECNASDSEDSDVDYETAAYDVGPRSTEEGLFMEDAMRRGIEQKNQARIDALKNSVSRIVDVAGDNIDQARKGVIIHNV